jgi:PAS domain S-box-containing protein
MVDQVESLIEEVARLRDDLAEARKTNRLLELREEERITDLEHANRDLEAEIARRKRIEEALRLQETRFEALFKLSQMTEASVQQIISFVLEEQIKITKSKVGTLALLDDDEKISSVYGWSRGLMEVCALPDEPMSKLTDEAGVWGQPMRERRPVIINDYSAPHPSKKGLPGGHVAITRLLGTPAINGDRIVALALVGNKEEDYDAHDVRQVKLLLDGMWRLIERKRAEMTLQERAELLDLASDSILVRDLEDKILFWNAGAEACYGWKKEEALGQVYHTLLQTRFPMPLEEIRGNLFQNSRWEGELIHVSRQGNEMVVASRWALLRDAGGEGRATLEISTDISDRKLMEKQLEEKSDRLQEVNIALKTLLKHRDDDKRALEEAILANIENLILPYLKRIKASSLSSTQAALLEVLESHVREITSEFGKTLALQYRVLTPTEMRVAALVRDGKTSKEIADLLCISEKTASFHRNNIRKKLGLRTAGINLRSHLLSFT